MKQKNLTVILAASLVAFLIFCLGYYFGSLNDGEEIRIVTAQHVPETSAASAAAKENNAASEAPDDDAATMTTSAPTAAVSAKAEQLLNINTATAEELEELPGIGPKLAERIVQYREKYGAFTSIEELKNVEGIGDKRFASIRDLVTVEDSNENSGS